MGITGFGADASKPYPNPADTSTGFSSTGYSGTTYPAGATFTEPGTTATAIPRYPTNIYYNVATQAEEVDEYNQIYLAPPAGNCDSTKTTCLSAASTFTDIANSVVNGGGGMFQHMMGNDPRPDYFHQSNMIGGASALYYPVMNQLLTEYKQYFNATTTPITQPTMAQIATLLTEQAKWAADQAATTPTVSGYIQGNQVTITNTASAVSAMPLTGVTTVGSAYGGTQSGWTATPATGTSVTYTAQITWPVDTLTVSLSPTAIAGNGVATSAATATLTADGKPVAGRAGDLCLQRSRREDQRGDRQQERYLHGHDHQLHHDRDRHYHRDRQLGNTGGVGSSHPHPGSRTGRGGDGVAQSGGRSWPTERRRPRRPRT